MSAVGDTKYVISSYNARQSGKWDFIWTYSAKNSHASGIFCDRVIIDLTSSLPFLSSPYVAFRWGADLRVIEPLRFLVSARETIISRSRKETHTLAGNFFLIATFLSSTICRALVFYRLAQIYRLGTETESFIPRRDNHLSAGIVREFLSSCKNVPPGGKAWTLLLNSLDGEARAFSSPFIDI